VPLYRLIFPPEPYTSIENAKTATIKSDEFLEVGSLVVHGGKRWYVTQAPLDQPRSGETADVLVWPAPPE